MCTHLEDDDRFDWDPVGAEAGTVMTEVCVKTWPSDVWMIKEMLEVKEGFEEEEEEEVFVVEDEDVSPAELDAAALEDAPEDELVGVEELDGAAVVCGAVVGAACEEGVGVGLEVAGALDAFVEAGVDTGARLWRNVSILESHYAQHDLRRGWG
jgi:hypothetical protein